jgi:hypothetical protein
MATISVSCAVSLINGANFFAIGIYDASSGSLLETIAPPKGGGYLNPFQATGVNSYTLGKVYRVVVWENTTAVVGGTSRVSGSVTPSSNSTSVRADKFYKYGVSSEMTSNTTIVDATIIGWGITLEQPGYGSLTPGTDYTYNSSTGTITMINGSTFQSGQQMVIHFQPQVATAVAAPSSGITSGRIITGTASLTNTDANTAIYLQGTGLGFVTTLPALSTMSDYQPIEFYSAGGSHINATLLCAGTDKIQWAFGQISQVILAQAEMIILFKANGVWNVKNPSSGIGNVGEIVMSYSGTELNTVPANGALLLRSSYPRLWNFVAGLSAGVTSEASWVHTTVVNGITYFDNKGLYTTGDLSTTFRVPLLYNYGSLKVIDGSTRAPGSFQAGQVGAFTDTPPLPIGDAFLGSGPSTRFGRGTASPSNTSFSVAFNAGKENYPSNVGIYGLIRI